MAPQVEMENSTMSTIELGDQKSGEKQSRRKVRKYIGLIVFIIGYFYNQFSSNLLRYSLYFFRYFTFFLRELEIFQKISFNHMFPAI